MTNFANLAGASILLMGLTMPTLDSGHLAFAGELPRNPGPVVPGVSAHQLIPDNATYYDTNPAQMAFDIEQRLNSIEAQGQRASQIVMVPDHHMLCGDGGVKNFIFLTSARPAGEEQRTWHTQLVDPDDESTMYQHSTSSIAERLEGAVNSLTQRGSTVAFVIPLVDHHNFVGRNNGEDGMKNIILAYY